MSLRKFRDALIVMGAFLAVIWILQVVNWADGYRLDSEFGILPEHVSRLGEIFTAPFLHFSWQHIEGNSVPLFGLSSGSSDTSCCAGSLTAVSSTSASVSSRARFTGRSLM